MGLIAGLRDWMTPLAMAEGEAQAIELAVDRIDPRLRLVSGYQRKLAPAVRYARAYCDGLVAAIPGPIDIDVRAFGNDPLVHAFFAAPDDIARMLSSSPEVRGFVAEPANAEVEGFFALIGMRRKEKIVPGLVRHGEVIHEGMPQRLLYFADHTLHELSVDLDQTRSRLRESSFASLVSSFAAQLAALHLERQSLHTAWEQERALARSANGEAVEAHLQRRQELEQGMREMAGSLEPAHVLDALAAWLADPAPRLHLIATSVSVDRLGVLSESADDPEVRTLSFPELIGRDRRHWIVLLARIARADAQHALQESRQAERYLVI